MNKKEAIEIIKKNWPDSRYTMLQEALQTLIPELKESEDEMIRQDIIDWLINYKDNVQVDLKDEEVDRWVSCLEKQGEQENLCDKCRKEQPSHSCQDITALGRCALEKQGEQKPVECIKFDNEFENQISHLIASVLNGEHEYNEGFVKYASQSLLGFAKKEQKSADKVKHEFKVGDWITTVNDVGVRVVENVVEFTGSKVRLVDTDGVYILCPQSWLNHYYFWTIQDAKDGDVLVDCLGNICIYQKLSTRTYYHTYCYGNHKNFIDGGGSHEVTGTYPATKEQCDLLFKKMKEAGYKWDAEKKELNKIEKQGEQKSSWSKDDEKMWVQVINEIEAIKSNSSTIFEKNIAQDKIDWLKSIKPNHWKPSKEQMEIVENLLACEMPPRHKKIFESLYNDLKNLRS